MASQKRSAAKYEATYPLPKSEDTIVEITNYATGEGKAMRRLRSSSSRHDALEEVIHSGINHDNRLKTPSPRRTKPAGPPKVDRQPHRQSRTLRYSGDSFFLDMPVQEVKDIMDASWKNSSLLSDEFHKYAPQESISPGDTPPLGSPFHYVSLPLPLPLPDPPSPSVLNEVILPPTSAQKGSPLRNETGTSSGHSNPSYTAT